MQLAQHAKKQARSVIAHGSDATDQAESYLPTASTMSRAKPKQTLADLCLQLLGADPDSRNSRACLPRCATGEHDSQCGQRRRKNPSWMQSPQTRPRTHRSRALSSGMARRARIFSPPMSSPAADALTGATGARSRSPATSFRFAQPQRSPRRSGNEGNVRRAAHLVRRRYLRSQPSWVARICRARLKPCSAPSLQDSISRRSYDSARLSLPSSAPAAPKSGWAWNPARRRSSTQWTRVCASPMS